MTMLCHDPRLSSDRDEKIETNNAALMQAEIVRQMFPDHELMWDMVTEMADYCDELVPFPS